MIKRIHGQDWTWEAWLADWLQEGWTADEAKHAWDKHPTPDETTPDARAVECVVEYLRELRAVSPDRYARAILARRSRGRGVPRRRPDGLGVFQTRSRAGREGAPRPREINMIITDKIWRQHILEALRAIASTRRGGKRCKRHNCGTACLCPACHARVALEKLNLTRK